MSGYITIGTNDLPRAATFYDTLFAEIGAGRLRESDRSIAWGTRADAPALGVCKPFDLQPATAGNGTMIALKMDAKTQVDALHAKALQLGGQDEGAPGPRGPAEFGYYGAYFRDMDGNKLCAFCIGAAG